MQSRNHPFLDCRELLQGIICYILPKASLGFEVTHEQFTVLPPSMKISSKGGERGEVSRQGFGQGSRWCPGSPQVFLSQHSEKAALWWLFLELSVEILQCINRLTTTIARDKGKDAWHEKNPSGFHTFQSIYIVTGSLSAKMSNFFLVGDDTKRWKQQEGLQTQPEGPALNRATPNWVEEDVSGWASLAIIYENYSCLEAY